MENTRSNSHLNAGRGWSDEEEKMLKQKLDEGATIEQIADILGRSPNAIEMRINKGLQLEVAAAYLEKLSFEWFPVLERPDKEYEFPNPLTDFMIQRYCHPTVYRWVVYQAEKSEVVYVGTCQKLCPDRLTVYLDKNPTGATKRIRTAFQELISNGKTVRLETLSFEQFIITPTDLESGHVRYFIEKLFINYHKSNGTAKLN